MSFITPHLFNNQISFFGADMYTIEFQKHGLSHAHLILFLHAADKYPTPNDIYRIISTEIPCLQSDKHLHDLVKTHMIHGPCGSTNKYSPCMNNEKCSRYYPKKFQQQTIIEQDGFATYNRMRKNEILGCEKSSYIYR